MNEEQRDIALQQMQEIATDFYYKAVKTNCHPFIEFAGLMNEYIKACRDAHEKGIDFTRCNRHTGQILPLEEYRSDYITEKLECIFSGQLIIDKRNEK